MKNTSQNLTSLNFDRKGDRQVAIDHMVKASSTVNSIIETVVYSGNVDSIEFDCEISPVWAIRVVMNGSNLKLGIEKYDRVEDDLINTEISLEEGKSLMEHLEELVLPSLIEEVKDYRYEREEYANENDGY